MKTLVTGSSGLIGSEAIAYFDRRGHHVHGIDNNLRRDLFGPAGDTAWNLHRLQETTRSFTHVELDVRNREAIFDFFRARRFDLIVHCAAQPSHDKAATIPLVDFDVNAGGTINLLEAARQYSPDAVFILIELETRYDYAGPEHYHGVSEECRIDRSLHSPFGASKAAADLIAQEYGRYYGMNVGVFRGSCLTGPAHSGVELHGFLSHLVKVAVRGGRYTVFGFQGKQVRDQIHSIDVVRAVEQFAGSPRRGEAYNLGGGRPNSASALECIAAVEELTGRKLDWRYQEQSRPGDHVCYISDTRKFKAHYPEWSVTRSLEDILEELVAAECARGAPRASGPEHRFE